MADMGCESALTKLGDFLDTIMKLNFPFLKEYKETIETIKKSLVVGKQGLKCVLALREYVIHPSKGICVLAHISAQIFKLTQKFIDLKPSLPKEVQKNVEDLEKNTPEIEQKLEEILNGIKEISQAINDQEGVEFSSEDKTKLNLKLEQLNGDCKLCENTLTTANKTLDEIQWKVQQWLGIFFLGFLNPFPMGTGFFWIGKAVSYTYRCTFAAAGALIGLGISYKLLSILADYSLALEECVKIKDSLKSLSEEFDKVKIEMETLEKKSTICGLTMGRFADDIKTN